MLKWKDIWPLKIGASGMGLGEPTSGCLWCVYVVHHGDLVQSLYVRVVAVISVWWLQCAVRPKAAFCIPRRAVSLITGRDADYRMCRARAGFKGCCWFWAAIFVTTPNGSCRGCHFWALGSHPVPYMQGVIRHHSPLRAVRKRESCSLESWGRCLLVRLLKWIN